MHLCSCCILFLAMLWSKVKIKKKIIQLTLIFYCKCNWCLCLFFFLTDLSLSWPVELYCRKLQAVEPRLMLTASKHSTTEYRWHLKKLHLLALHSIIILFILEITYPPTHSLYLWNCHLAFLLNENYKQGH